ncbi:MAG: site-specific integrase [Candidatus Omnitrophica bacterium]|nr:site-specific integrase [Candidatus Omnitrophota bacterium]
MGTIFKRKNKTGTVYGINYIDPEGNQIRKVVSPYKETAKRVLSKIETEIAEGKYLDIRQKKEILFEDFAQRFLDVYMKLENKNPKSQMCCFNNLVKYFRGKYLHKIDNFTVRQFIAKRIKEVKPSTVNRHFSMLKSMFNRAIEWNLFDGRNPTVGIKKLPENNERCRWLNAQEQARLLAHCKGATHLSVLIALKTGMRWGEIISLKRKQIPNSNYVDFDNDVIYIHESLSKGKKSRYIPMGATLKGVLKSFPKQPGTDYIFLNPKTDKPIGSLKKSFKNALVKAGIDNFTFHDLRHTFASQLVINGVDLYVVQKLLGHSTIKMTERYAHLQPAQFKDAVGKLEKIDLLLNDLRYNNISENSTNLAQIPFLG